MGDDRRQATLGRGLQRGTVLGYKEVAGYKEVVGYRSSEVQ